MKKAKITLNCKITIFEDLTEREEFQLKTLFETVDFDKKVESKLKECLETNISNEIIIDIKEIRKEILDGKERGQRRM